AGERRCPPVPPAAGRIKRPLKPLAPRKICLESKGSEGNKPRIATELQPKLQYPPSSFVCLWVHGSFHHLLDCLGGSFVGSADQVAVNVKRDARPAVAEASADGEDVHALADQQ